jgi:hypothetical protein
VVAVVTKTRNEEIRIGLTRFKDMHLVDVRVFAGFEGMQEARPTKRGIRFRIGKLSALIAGLQAALEEAKRQALLPEAGAP